MFPIVFWESFSTFGQMYQEMMLFFFKRSFHFFFTVNFEPTLQFRPGFATVRRGWCFVTQWRPPWPRGAPRPWWYRRWGWAMVWLRRRCMHCGASRAIGGLAYECARSCAQSYAVPSPSPPLLPLRSYGLSSPFYRFTLLLALTSDWSLTWYQS